MCGAASFCGNAWPAAGFVVLEATGHHDRLLRHALGEAGIGVCPHQSDDRAASPKPRFCRGAAARSARTIERRAARRRGLLAKTDRLDARTLSGLGVMFKPSSDPAPCRQRGGWPLLPAAVISLSTCASGNGGIFPKLSTRPSLPISRSSSPTSTAASPPSNALHGWIKVAATGENLIHVFDETKAKRVIP